MRLRLAILLAVVVDPDASAVLDGDAVIVHDVTNGEVTEDHICRIDDRDTEACDLCALSDTNDGLCDIKNMYNWLIPQVIPCCYLVEVASSG